MFCHLILSFVCAHIGPGLSVYVHIYIHLQPRLQVAQVLTMRWGSLVVPVHLVPLSSQLRTFCPVLSSLHVFIFLSLLRTHVHIALTLVFLASPRGGACVCVCVCPL